ncbi:MAG: ATP-binding cassette domain-containing protein, partial [Spirochaetales bacterium]
MGIIDLQHVSKRYITGSTTLTVLDDISASFEPGTITVITGSSGSGKSTLLNLIGGLDRVSDGEIIAAGHPIHSLSETDLTGFRSGELGFVFQFHHLLKDFTA